MKKNEIYVPIANKKEAKRAKAVLEAMGEVIKLVYWLEDKPSSDQTQLVFHKDGWMVAKHWEERAKITLKQLIELLVSEANDNAKYTSVEKKIAVRVENEKEFNALMKYYDSLGYNAKSGRNTTELSYITYSDLKPYILVAISDGVLILPNFDGYKIQGTEDYNPDNYKIIPFSEFAKEHGIRVRIGVTHDGVEVYKGDCIVCVNIDGKYIGNDEREINEAYELRVTSHYYFSTKQAAIDWIEAQKPKEFEYKVPSSDITLRIKKNAVLGFEGLSYLNLTDIKAILSKLEELNNG